MRTTSIALTTGIASAAVLLWPTMARAQPPAAADAMPTFDYRDCPPIPAGLDRAKWRCEVHVASGTVKIGKAATTPFTITAMTHAEGPLPDGTSGQIFSGLHGRTTRVPGGLLGLPLGIRPESAGSADLLTPGGLIDLKFRLVSPLLGGRCTLGSNAEPIKIGLSLVPGSAVWVSQDPPIRRMDGTDTTFTVPRASGCGPAARLLDRRFGLPSPSGANSLAIRVHYSYKTYDTLPASEIAG
ncbi:hypothetical protein ACRYCC_38055 [Actinomadura scrupuli]|uniref:hypothetical protein n=1 Tax=Actinomadura scrupuli TaxID=559629 RepID=UPI003D96AC13